MSRRIVCIGGAHVDRIARAKGAVRLGSSNPVTVRTSVGGVACNVARVAARLGADVAFIGLVGDDDAGRRVRAALEAEGVDTAGLAVSPDAPTATYSALLDAAGELVVALADMDIYERMTPAWLGARDAAIDRSSDNTILFTDANPPIETIAGLWKRGDEHYLVTDAVSVDKAERVEVLADLHFRNRDEMPYHVIELAIGAEHTDIYIVQDETYVVTFGARGACVLTTWTRPFWVPAAPADVRDVTGAGDAMIGALLAAASRAPDLYDYDGWLEGALRYGALAAAITVETDGGGVSPHLDDDSIQRRVKTLALPEPRPSEADLLARFRKVVEETRRD